MFVVYDFNMLFVGLVVCKLMGCKFVYDFYEFYFECNIGDCLWFKENFFWIFIERFVIVECDVVMLVVEGICCYLEMCY